MMNGVPPQMMTVHHPNSRLPFRHPHHPPQPAKSKNPLNLTDEQMEALIVGVISILVFLDQYRRSLVISCQTSPVRMVAP